MRGRRHSDDLKAKVIAALIAGQHVMEIAKAYQIGEGTVRNWKRGLPREQLTQLTQPPRDFGDLVGDYLTALLKTLKAQADHVRKPEFLAKQSAADIAVLHETFAGKGLAILAAAERANGSAGDD